MPSVKVLHQAAAVVADNGHVDINVSAWHWLFLLGAISALLLVDLLVIHRRAHVVAMREAIMESIAWIAMGVLFGIFIWWQFGTSAMGEYFGSYLMEKSLSVDNVFIWAMLFTYFEIPRKHQHRVLFWGIFGALALRSVFIFGGLAVIEIFEPAVLILGIFLVYTAVKIFSSSESDPDFNPSDGRTLRLFRKFVASTEEIHGQALFIRDDTRGLLATPLFAVLILVELTDVVFAVDSVPAILSITSEQFIAIASNVFAILGLRALYFLLADVRTRFKYLQSGISVVLAFVGAKMVLGFIWNWHVSTKWSLSAIIAILTIAVTLSVVENRRPS